jgi:heterodisulfide reductase subunit A-like polyferredoxin
MANLIDNCAAKILSQVKMGSDTVVYGRVNIDTYSPKVVKALLAGVPLGGTYASPASTGTTVTEADAAAIAARSLRLARAGSCTQTTRSSAAVLSKSAA